MISIDVNKAMLAELTLAVQKVMDRYGLAGSDLEKSVEFKYEKNQFILLANDYYQSVVYGRKRGARLVPVEDLIKWMKKKGISPRNGTYNQVAFMIQQSIFRNGIKARDFSSNVEEITTIIIAEDLATMIAEDIENEITNNINLIKIE